MSTRTRDGGSPEAVLPLVVRRKNYGTIIFGVVLVLASAGFVHNLITNPRWEWPVVAEYLFSDQVLKGLVGTLYLTFVSAITGLIVGLITAMMRLSSSRLISGFAAAYVGFTRAVPALVLLLFVFYAAALFPTVQIGIPFGPILFEVSTNDLISQFSAAVIGLTVILGAHLGEIIRGGIISVDRGQTEAAKALGMPPLTILWRIILPQATRVAIPAIANELISLFKNTSLVSIIGFAELLTVVQLIYGITYQTIPLLLVACLWYGVLTAIAMYGQRRLEMRFSRGIG